MSINKQRTMKSMVMTPDFEARFTAVNGVMVPSKIPPGGHLYKKPERPSWEKKTKNICSICGSDCYDKRGLRDHFVVCVGRNGNPNGACWDDSLKLLEAANTRSDMIHTYSLFSY